MTSTDAEIHAFSFFLAAILDLRSNGMIYKVVDTTTKKLDTENMGLVARISFLSALELKIPLAKLTTLIALGGLKPPNL